MSNHSGIVDVSTLTSWKDFPACGHAEASTYDVDDDLNDRIIIWRGDITRLDVDAIVNAANSKLRAGGGICGAIFDGAGPELDDACEDLGGCETGSAAVTPGFDLPARFILHAVGPIYRKSDPEVSKQHLTSCYTACLDQGTAFNMRSIAFCCISTGIYGYPKDDAAKVAFGTIRAWLEHGSNRNNIDKIVFCVFDKHDERLYRATAAQFFPRSKDIAPPADAAASGAADAGAAGAADAADAPGAAPAGEQNGKDSGEAAHGSDPDGSDSLQK